MKQESPNLYIGVELKRTLRELANKESRTLKSQIAYMCAMRKIQLGKSKKGA